MNDSILPSKVSPYAPDYIKEAAEAGLLYECETCKGPVAYSPDNKDLQGPHYCSQSCADV